MEYYVENAIYCLIMVTAFAGILFVGAFIDEVILGNKQWINIKTKLIN